MLNTFITRTPFEYGIPSLDKLLKTDAIPDSFLLYDEQILQILKAAGIPGPEAYATTKAIKKKKIDKVLAAKDKFKTGFTKYLQETENASEEKASEVVEEVWTIIENAASYMFCAAHAFSMACDSLYAAWLKVHYPYELYVTMLKLYDQKKNTDKISSIIAEMKRYKHITLTAGRFGQDNRDWLVDKEHGTISQSLSSIRYMSRKAAQDLYKIGQKTVTVYEEFDDDYMAILEGRPPKLVTKQVPAFDNFTDLLRELQMNSCLDTRQIRILIELDYFASYGPAGKLMKVYDEFFEGKQKLTKTVKSYEARLATCREYEKSLGPESLPITQRLNSEFFNVGLCLSTDPKAPSNLYFIKTIDAKYGVKADLYSVQRGTSGVVRFKKDDFAVTPFEEGDCLEMLKFNKSPRYIYKDGTRTPIPGEFDIWARSYRIIKGNKAQE